MGAKTDGASTLGTNISQKINAVTFQSLLIQMLWRFFLDVLFERVTATVTTLPAAQAFFHWNR